MLRGNWSFYSDWNFAALYGAPVPPGVYRDLGAIGVAYYDMSSLRPAVPETTAAGADILGHVILFQEPNLHGPHKHVFIDHDVQPDTTYFYRIRAFHTAADGAVYYSGYSDTITVVTPPKPRGH